MAQKWLLPFKKFRKNYERINSNYGLEHDIGFGGDKIYKVFRIEKNSYGVDSPSSFVGSSYYKRGEALKAIKELSRTSNPTVTASSLPIGQWSPAHAIRQNADGTVDVLREKNSGRRANISEGFMAGGVFHPIRHSWDYDSSRAGERKVKKKAPTKKKAATRKRAVAKKRVVKKKATRTKRAR